MQDVFDTFTIIMLVLALLIFWKLRSVLGQRTGRERPPYDPFSARDQMRGSTGDKVVTLPTRAVEQGAKPVEVQSYFLGVRLFSAGCGQSFAQDEQQGKDGELEKERNSGNDQDFIR